MQPPSGCSQSGIDALVIDFPTGSRVSDIVRRPVGCTARPARKDEPSLATSAPSVDWPAPSGRASHFHHDEKRVVGQAGRALINRVATKVLRTRLVEPDDLL